MAAVRAQPWPRLREHVVCSNEHERKLLISLRLAWITLRLSDRYKRRNKPPELLCGLNVLVDRLLDNLLSCYDGAVCPRDLDESFDDLEEAMTFSRLREVCQGTVPITIMRGLLHLHDLEFETDAVPNWHLFDARYGAMLIRQPKAS